MESNRLANLVSWLRISAAGSLDPHVGQAADAIEAQAKRIDELKAALKPFAEYTAWLDAHEYDPDDTIICGFDVKYYLTAGDCRQARKVLGKNK